MLATADSAPRGPSLLKLSGPGQRRGSRSSRRVCRCDGVTAARSIVILSLARCSQCLLRVPKGVEVASPILFDLSQFDPDAVAVSAEEVGRIIPQAGDMRQLSHLIWLTDDAKSGVGVKYVGDDEFWVPGHVPGRPLLPGVMMIEAAAQLSSVLIKLQGHPAEFFGFVRCDDAVFRGQVVPGDTLYLLAQELDYKRRRFISQTQGVVNGQLVFEAKITGMAM